ncbi:hypothetical protein JB92DRAFT_2868741 [Gautieria morchelliformis]|nr:hypothetical protein JB92DRAFT_2868741 [Gautieria morchelliformis]
MEVTELVVSELSLTGESLSVLPSPHKPWVVAVPFALAGEWIHPFRYGGINL